MNEFAASFASVGLATGLDQGALAMAKYGATTGQHHNLLIILSTMVLGGLAYYNIMMALANDSKTIGVTNAQWNVMSTMLALFIGAFFWGEKLTKAQTGGFVLALVSLYLLADQSKNK